MENKLDPWQEEFLRCKGDKILCTGRQVGKSFIVSVDASRYAVSNPNRVVLMIAPVERQAFALFDKTLSYLFEHHRNMIKKGKDRPTKSRIKLTNGTVIWCLPTGLSGQGIRFLTVDRLYVDEAARVGEDVWSAVTPMLLTRNGTIIMLSTPFGKGNRFSDVVTNKDSAYDSFTRFHTNSLDVMKDREICATWTEQQRDGAIKLLHQERSRMTALEYAQEYEGELVDELRQFFPTELIKKCMTILRGVSTVPPDSSILSGDTFLGVDVGRSRDVSALVSLRLEHSILSQIDMKVTSDTRLTDTVREVLNYDRIWDYNKIYIDDGGLGVGVFDPLLEHPQTKRKVVAINNSSRSINQIQGKDRKRTLLKEDLYNNLLSLMERGKINLWKNDEIMYSLMSIQAEHVNNKLKIFGSNSHITEALIRAAWGVKDKRLSIWIC